MGLCQHEPSTGATCGIQDALAQTSWELRAPSGSWSHHHCRSQVGFQSHLGIQSDSGSRLHPESYPQIDSEGHRWNNPHNVSVGESVGYCHIHPGNQRQSRLGIRLLGHLGDRPRGDSGSDPGNDPQSESQGHSGSRRECPGFSAYHNHAKLLTCNKLRHGKGGLSPAPDTPNCYLLTARSTSPSHHDLMRLPWPLVPNPQALSDEIHARRQRPHILDAGLQGRAPSAR
jgi:hypothetical protein